MLLVEAEGQGVERRVVVGDRSPPPARDRRPEPVSQLVEEREALVDEITAGGHRYDAG